MGMAHGNGSMMMRKPIYMKENISAIKSVVMVYFDGRLAISTKAISLTMLGTDMEKCSGMMVPTIKECGIKVNKVEKERL